MALQTAAHDGPVLFLALELSKSAWLLAAHLPGANKPKLHRIEAGDTAALLATIPARRARAAGKSGPAVAVPCCFEGGGDGSWLPRLLTANGVASHVLEPSSILVDRRARRAKTDRLDAQGLLRVLMAYCRGDRQACSMVRVPTPEEEDAKRLHREREHLVQERVRVENRLEALLATQGIRGRPSLRSWERGHGGRAHRRRARAAHPAPGRARSPAAPARADAGDDPGGRGRAGGGAGRRTAGRHLPHDRGAVPDQGHRRDLRYRARARGALPPVRQPQAAGELRRARADASPERGHGPGPADRPVRQPPRADGHHPARLALAALPARQRARRLVPRARRRPGRADPADRHRGHGAQAADRALEIRPDRAAARGGRDRGVEEIAVGGTPVGGGAGSATVFVIGSVQPPRFRWVVFCRGHASRMRHSGAGPATDPTACKVMRPTAAEKQDGPGPGPQIKRLATRNKDEQVQSTA